MHEELVLQWFVSTGSVRELAMTNAWFFFELIVSCTLTYFAFLFYVLLDLHGSVQCCVMWQKLRIYQKVPPALTAVNRFA